MIRVLLVDDSITAQLHLKHLLSADTEMQVVAVAFNGEEAIEATARYKPDLVLMDVQMPKMNGIEATQRIMATMPLPIIIVSARSDDPEMALRAVAVGALAVQEKPPGFGHPQYEESAAKFLQSVRQMAGVKVVRRWSLGTTASTAPSSATVIGTSASAVTTFTNGNPSPITPTAALPLRRSATRDVKSYLCPELIAVGASTGGPPVLATIFGKLPATFPVPILVVQHIAAGFLPGMITWLSAQTPLPVRIAVHGEQPQAGHIYIAPDHTHLGVTPDHRLQLAPTAPERGLRPAVSFLFRSVAQNYGAKAAGVLLTGMGKDGAEELGQMHSLGAPTLAQDQHTSVVHGMPGEAIRLGAATWILPPEEIATTLLRLTS